MSNYLNTYNSKSGSSINKVTLIFCFFYLTIGLSQPDNFKFESTFQPESDYILYYNEEKLNNFKTIYTSTFEIDSKNQMISHKKGYNLKSKKPWLDTKMILDKSEIDGILGIPLLKRLPKNHDKYYKSLRNRPIVTMYLKTPNHDIFIQWEGANPPNKKVVVRLMKFYRLLTDFIHLKLQEST